MCQSYYRKYTCHHLDPTTNAWTRMILHNLLRCAKYTNALNLHSSLHCPTAITPRFLQEHPRACPACDSSNKDELMPSRASAVMLTRKEQVKELVQEFLNVGTEVRVEQLVRIDGSGYIIVGGVRSSATKERGRIEGGAVGVSRFGQPLPWSRVRSEVGEDEEDSQSGSEFEDMTSLEEEAESLQRYGIRRDKAPVMDPNGNMWDNEAKFVEYELAKAKVKYADDRDNSSRENSSNHSREVSRGRKSQRCEDGR